MLLSFVLGCFVSIQACNFSFLLVQMASWTKNSFILNTDWLLLNFDQDRLGLSQGQMHTFLCIYVEKKYTFVLEIGISWS